MSALPIAGAVQMMNLRDDVVVWTPDDLSAVWWMRADLGHLLADGAAVSTAIANQGTGGAAWDISQPTASRQPTFDAAHASFNNQAVIDFDGSDVLYTIAGSHWHLGTGSGDDCTIIVVGRSTESANRKVLGTDNNASGGFRLHWRTNGSGAVHFYDSASTNLNHTHSTATQNSVHVFAAVLDSAALESSDVLTYWMDGTAAGSGSKALGAIQPSSGTEELCLGGDDPNSGIFNGQVAEVILHKALLSAGEDASLTSYFNSRYGLSLSGVTK